MHKTEQQRAIQWIQGRDTGTSSKTIWSVMMDAVDGDLSSWRYDTPSDDDDFGRCYRLLALIPEWRGRLPEVGKVFPKWSPLIREWDRLTTLHEAKDSKSVYQLIHSLDDECMLAAGYTKTGRGSWSRGDSKQSNLGNGVTISI